MPDMIRVLLVDDHPILRSGLSGLLELEPDLEVVGEASTGEEAVERVKILRPVASPFIVDPDARSDFFQAITQCLHPGGSLANSGVRRQLYS